MKGYDTMRVNDKLGKKMIKMNFAKTTYIPSTNMTLVSLNKLKKKGYVWDMHTDVLIHKASGQKVCNIENHYGLTTIEFNPMKMTVASQKNAPSMTKEEEKSLTKEDASEENSPIVTKDDAPIEEKENTMQKEDAPTLKKPHTDPVLAAMSAASGEEILMNHQELYATVPDPD
jgi:hypothetical protein